jgi:hypothetical protein
LQRKVLPKYLLALDDQTSLLLLKCLARLQPPLVPAPAARPGQQQVASSSNHLLVLPEQLQQGSATSGAWQHQQQQLQQQRAQLTAAVVPTSINGAIRDRYLLTSSSALLAAASIAPAADAAAADVAAAARGFASAADERAQFDLMLAGVCAVLQQKLPAWSDRRMVEALCWLAQLHTYHEGFIQVGCMQ